MRFSYINIIPIITYLFIMSNLSAQSVNNQLTLMPFPSKVVQLDGKFRLENSFNVSINGLQSERVLKSVNRMIRVLSKRTGLFLEYPNVVTDTLKNPKMLIEFARLVELRLKVDESYKLVIENNLIKLTAPTDIGILRGLATLYQLLSIDELGYYFPNIKIDDRPRFPWRGLMLDVCRHFMPIEVIKRNLDGMAAVKLNVFHWHLSEDQGFRIECKTFPKLHKLGSDGLFYTHKQVEEIIEYASERGIRVIPEFDIPGHSTSWLVGYPELGSAPGPYTIERKFGIKDPTFNPALDETYIFFDKFFKEMSALFPDEYMHIGGDENNGKQWDASEEIQKFMKDMNISDNHELQGYFNNRLLQILTKYNKKMIGWDEIFHPSMPNNIVIQSWRGKEAMIEAAKKGYQGILSNGYYIDLMQPTEYHYLNDPIGEKTKLTEQDAEFILGGEATMWSEWVTPENVDSRIWPRTAAIAERFWSPREIKDVDDMFDRLNLVSLLLEEFGLTHITFQEKMLRRLTNGKDTTPLKTLINFVEPLQEYKRAQNAKENGFEYTQLSPYTRTIDATIIDNSTLREFKLNVRKLISDKDSSSIEKICVELRLLKENHVKLIPIIKSSPNLKEIEPISLNLNKLAEVGLNALEMISQNKKASSDWFEDAEEIIFDCKKSYGQVEIVIVESIVLLVGALK
jgi:hexosaminidase